MADSICETDITSLVLFSFEGRDFWVSPGTLLQCLHIAAHEARVPPLDPEWIERAIPEGYRAKPRGPEDVFEERPDRAGHNRDFGAAAHPEDSRIAARKDQKDAN